MEDARFAVKYREQEGDTVFAWFIIKKDAALFADVMGRQEGLTFEVISL